MICFDCTLSINNYSEIHRISRKFYTATIDAATIDAVEKVSDFPTDAFFDVDKICGYVRQQREEKTDAAHVSAFVISISKMEMTREVFSVS